MALIDDLPGMAYRCRNDHDWTMELVSAGAEELTGHEPAALVGNAVVSYASLIHADDRDLVWRQVQRALATGDRFQITYRIRTASGETKWVWEQGRGIFGEDGELQRLEGFIFDATERKAAEGRFRSVFESSPMGMHIYQLDDDGRLVLSAANPAADEILEIDHAPLIGRTLEDAFPGLVGTEVPERFATLAAEGGTWSSGKLPYEHGGIQGIYQVQAFQTFPGQVTVMFYDVTLESELEEQVRRSQRLESVGRLAGGVAHDFNNVLTAVTGYSQLLLAKGNLDDAARHDLERILESARRAAALTRQLLAFSRKQMLELKVQGLNEIVEGLTKMLERLIRADIELITLLGSEVDNVKADRGQIEQVLMNLVVNASDAMPAGGKLTIETENMEVGEEYAGTHLGITAGRYVVLTVSDTGTGMDKETAARVFEPFFTTKEEGKGTGLGLSTAYGIVEQHGGHIWVDSVLGQGTVFKVFLPPVDEQIERRVDADHSAESLRGSETVLLVDDSADVREPVSRMLAELGYTVLEAAHPREALRIGADHKGEIHLLLTDIVMPEINGVALAQQFGSLRPECAVLFMTGYTDEGASLENALGHGAGILRKPFTATDLGLRLREVLAGGRR